MEFSCGLWELLALVSAIVTTGFAIGQSWQTPVNKISKKVAWKLHAHKKFFPSCQHDSFLIFSNGSKYKMFRNGTEWYEYPSGRSVNEDMQNKLNVLSRRAKYREELGEKEMFSGYLSKEQMQKFISNRA